MGLFRVPCGAFDRRGMGMISGCWGGPGPGKSYEATRRVRDELKTGRVVITTLPLVADAEYWSPFLESGAAGDSSLPR